MTFDPQRPSWWISTTPSTTHPPLRSDLRVDVAVVGAGITGITAAYLLKKAGKKVALLERGRAAMAETGHTTAHLTHVVDTRLVDLVRTFGEAGAKAAWDSSRAALDQIEALVREWRIDCDFQRVPGYLFGTRDSDVPLLQEEARLANQFGYRAEQVRPADFPFRSRIVLKFDNQARFHPRRYLLALLAQIPGGGSEVFEETNVKTIESGPPVRVVSESGAAVTCDHVLVAAHVPFQNRVLIHAKQAAYRSYVLAARTPKGKLADALYWDVLDPYHYVRLQPGPDHDLVILGGEDHKTGQVTDTEGPYQKLVAFLRDELGPEAVVVARWSGQIMETVDGLPYIGANVVSAPNELVATGYAGNGLTYGTLAGLMLAERILGRSTPWDKLYDPGRVKIRGTWEFVKENLDYPLHLLKDRLRGAEARALPEVGTGQGKIVKLDGKKVAVARDETGAVHAVSAVCPHMGCQVHWNVTERTWDCPCHGSRFLPTGEVLNGPAITGLEPVEVREPAPAH
jgi:glycine/D-amino acid oxidase-like deaminating enzyme/nitrite reductase/ring-hydroxylating ferredoxin subunit